MTENRTLYRVTFEEIKNGVVREGHIVSENDENLALIKAVKHNAIPSILTSQLILEEIEDREQACDSKEDAAKLSAFAELCFAFISTLTEKRGIDYFENDRNRIRANLAEMQTDKYWIVPGEE